MLIVEVENLKMYASDILDARKQLLQLLGERALSGVVVAIGMFSIHLGGPVTGYYDKEFCIREATDIEMENWKDRNRKFTKYDELKYGR